MQSSKTKDIQIVVNGENRSVPDELVLGELLTVLNVLPDRVAVELNGAIVKKQDWPATSIRAGAQLEIVQFVGGG
jgi:sulfur carrier protein